MQATERSPLSLDTLITNGRHYPQADRCEALALSAQNAFLESIQARQQLVKWTVISACTLLTTLASLKLPSRYKSVVGIISTIFFFIVCLPKLKQVVRREAVAKATEDLIYTNAKALIDEIINNCSIEKLIKYLPKGTFLESEDPIKVSVNQNLVITQELLNGLDRFINQEMRIVHQWNLLKRNWSQDRLQSTFNNTPAAHTRFLVDEFLIGERLPLAWAIHKIEQCREHIENTLNLKTEYHSDRADMAQAFPILLRYLLSAIQDVQTANNNIEQSLQSLIELVNNLSQINPNN